MLLKNLIELRNSIDAYRNEMYRLKVYKGKSDPLVLEINHLLDEKVNKMEKIIAEINSSQNFIFNS